MKILAFVEKTIAVVFYLLFFFVPLVLYPFTSELFEFNKMVLTYVLTTLIVAAWLTRMILVKRFIFRRTILDIPILVFLGFQFVSTLVSIDFRTSFLGYYSRFHGGFLSSLSYSLLYWAFVSNMDRRKTLFTVYCLLFTGILVSAYGVAEHFGIDKDLWVQDVQNRVFSTLGQPNWLAAWLVALLPTTWALALNSKLKTNISKPYLITKNFWIYMILSALFFLTLLYTKSRSGILGFIISYLLFWGGMFWLRKELVKPLLRKFLVISSSLLVISLTVGTPWTPSLSSLFKESTVNNRPAGRNSQQSIVNAPALEVGGTESGDIRKIVWKGAVETWKHNPLFGTGPETFAFSYYNFRPVEHNLVSEWDFLYNKAHNEYLNYLANTGLVGLVSYLLVIIVSIVIMSNAKWPMANKNENLSFSIYNLALMAGYASILMTNFFGFSVVPLALQFFLFPAMAMTLRQEGERVKETDKDEYGPNQKIGIFLILLFTLSLFYLVSRYWYADLFYAQGKLLNDKGDFVAGRMATLKATALSPDEAIFWDELAKADAGIALTFFGAGEKGKAQEFAERAQAESQKATLLSPRNLNIQRNRASLFIKLSTINPDYLQGAAATLFRATTLAPTDAKIFYNLGLIQAKLGDGDGSMATLQKTIEMKPNYRDARLALAILFTQKGEKEKAKSELNFILERIDPNDTVSRGELEKLGK